MNGSSAAWELVGEQGKSPTSSAHADSGLNIAGRPERVTNGRTKASSKGLDGPEADGGATASPEGTDNGSKPSAKSETGRGKKSDRKPDSNPGSRRFEDWVQELRVFADSNGHRYPSLKGGGGSGDSERNLALWLSRIRLSFRNGNVLAEQKYLLQLHVPMMRARFLMWEEMDEETIDPIELAAESGLSEAVLEALPADAPKGHECYKKVIWRTAMNIAVFQYPIDGVKVNFQTTLNASCASQYAACRIARACYMRFEQNDSKDSVLEFRAACYALMQEAHRINQEEAAAKPGKRRKVKEDEEGKKEKKDKR